jgi:hypothetical protein
MYGTFILLEPFLLSKSMDYRRQLMLEQQYMNRNQFSVQDLMQQQQYLPRVQPMMPLRSEKVYITLSFMLCVAVGIALLGLGGFHMYLVSTGQTTIEFHGNWPKRRRRAVEAAATTTTHVSSSSSTTTNKHSRKNEKWQNPYSRGTILANWQQVYGISSLPFLQWFRCGYNAHSWINLLWCIMVPHHGLPHFLPVPIPGQCTVRTSMCKGKNTRESKDDDDIVLRPFHCSNNINTATNAFKENQWQDNVSFA